MTAAALATRLRAALHNEEAPSVEALLKQGADPNLVLPDGAAAIHLAAGKERESGVRCLSLLLQHGGDPNARSVDALTPLHVAASWGCYKCLKLLLKKGGNPELQDQDGNRAIDLALEQGNKECVRILRECQVSVDEEEGPCVPARGEDLGNSLFSVFNWDGMDPSHLWELSDVTSGPLSSTHLVLEEDSAGSFRRNGLRSAPGPPGWTEEVLTLGGSNPESPRLLDPQLQERSRLVRPLASEGCPRTCSSEAEGHAPADLSDTITIGGEGCVFGPSPQGQLAWAREDLPLSSPGALGASDLSCPAGSQDLSQLLGLAATSPDRTYLFWHNCCATPGTPAKAEPRDTGLGAKVGNPGSSGTSSYLQPVQDEETEGTPESSSREAGPSHKETQDTCPVAHLGHGDTEIDPEVTFDLPPPSAKCGGFSWAAASPREGPANSVLRAELRAMMLSTKVPPPTTPHARGRASESDTLPIREIGDPDACVPPPKAPGSPAPEEPLSAILQGILLAPPDYPHQESYRFVTPRTPSRLRASASQNSSSSTTLFDESLELPRRVQRVRSPPREAPPAAGSPGDDDGDAGSSSHSSSQLSGDLPHSLSGPGAPLSSPPASQSSLLVPGGDGPPPLVSSDSLAGPEPSAQSPQSTLGGDNSSNNFLTDDQSSPDSENSVQRWFTEEEESWMPQPLWPCSSYAQKGAAEQAPGAQHPTQPRCSFSRLSAQGPSLPEPPLSPGGRPQQLSGPEPVEYLYTDPMAGHSLIERHLPGTEESASDTSASDTTIIYDWRSCMRQQSTPPAEAPRLSDLSDQDLLCQLRAHGKSPGPVTPFTRKHYLRWLQELQNASPTSVPGPGSPMVPRGHSPELTLALRTGQVPDAQADEEALARQFDQPDKSQRWREGILKSSFTYLLLDPRVTQNLPARCQSLSPAQCFQTFASAIFYVGKGKRSRPYQHLYESLKHYRSSKKQACPKVRHILEIWASGQGVVSMHCFQNVIPVEAYTREACLVDALGMRTLTNQKKGNYYGVVASWPPRRQRRLGVYLLHRALHIFLAEGERQLRPPDLRAGP
ncbi:ankyrin repeat and LEM domain-containing protein 1 [Ornithorhynchus anatinus]|uniref:ankyrin repeat and LEM domain-containing protein 1 n=1 Tax=Ornithorhynchus anatinus TaxID=9258 RepID=UPI0019D4B331|nr:ankyrin repeat and LEM domain-containing protein 1 [Ornithorhynchus anatinus]